MNIQENAPVNYITESDVPAPDPQPVTAGLSFSLGGQFPTGGLTEALTNLDGYNADSLGALMLDGVQVPDPHNDL